MVVTEQANLLGPNYVSLAEKNNTYKEIILIMDWFLPYIVEPY